MSEDLDRGSEDLTRTFERMSRVLFSEETLQTALDLMCALAKETIPGTAGAGITLVRVGRHLSVAFTDLDLVPRADDLQYKLGEGPCLSSMQDRKVYRMDSVSSDERWPKWSAAASALGIQSCLSSPLLVHGAPIGAVKVYSLQPNQFTEHDERVLAMYAEHAAIVLANAVEYNNAEEISGQLKQALETRDLIGMAKGMLMLQEDLDEEAAFNMLRSASQHENIKVRDIARRLVDRTVSPDRD
ncbi:MAG: GAF and ANTAR domain-containing protein [Actinobacteria bacterium]|nr:GAF and ANTAR domain-containing protein [Actinomycetota bacterium]